MRSNTINKRLLSNSILSAFITKGQCPVIGVIDDMFPCLPRYFLSFSSNFLRIWISLYSNAFFLFWYLFLNFLIATILPVRLCLASYTWPKLPSPMISRSWYSPKITFTGFFDFISSIKGLPWSFRIYMISDPRFALKGLFGWSRRRLALRYP